VICSRLQVEVVKIFLKLVVKSILTPMMRRSFLRKALLPGVLCFLLLTAGTIDLDNLFDYNGQVTPFYITKDNQPMDNMITDEGATLGRVLFYDKQLSLNGTIACASCHKQEFAFSDTAVRSVGFEGGLTGRHSMRLINSRFADDMRFFWDKRAESLEDQTTMPVQDHVEMGFSGTGGQPGIDSLLNRLASIGHYQQLFTMVFGDAEVTEARIQRALAQFVRSIQSFDSKYDAGRAIKTWEKNFSKSLLSMVVQVVLNVTVHLSLT
jgi:cytochrome c peroxidase